MGKKLLWFTVAVISGVVVAMVSGKIMYFLYVRTFNMTANIKISPSSAIFFDILWTLPSLVLAVILWKKNRPCAIGFFVAYILALLLAIMGECLT